MPIVYVPMSREIYNDVIRFSDGHLDPAAEAEEALRRWIEITLENNPDLWGERAIEVAEKYAPEIAEQWAREDTHWIEGMLTQRRALVWKEITVPAGSSVRMSYGGEYRIAKISNGKIVDDDGEYSPSEWASKVAEGTSRNAWRDLWFKLPNSTEWVPAQVLREASRKAQLRKAQELTAGEDA